ncbi:MAG: hypothetical protein LQ338_006211 [Usnochroma carphineum]|nr:MAG: hypothetical protein LQ338_006211 [Usnochroma carphineum]
MRKCNFTPLPRTSPYFTKPIHQHSSLIPHPPSSPSIKHTEMAEPQPPTIKEGSDPTSETPAVPASAEDRKAFAALSTLDTQHTASDDTQPSTKTKNIDQEALARAISRLEVSAGAKEVAISEREQAWNERRKREREEREKVGRVKVAAEDVGLLELELSKGKVTELLKAHEGDAVRAMRVYVTAGV